MGKEEMFCVRRAKMCWEKEATRGILHDYQDKEVIA